MSGNAIQRLIHSRELGDGAGPPGGNDEDVVATAFSYLRGMRERALMFEVRHRDGRVSAFTYAILDHAEFDPSEGITLRFGRNEVRLTGRNLNSEIRPNVSLFNSILRHRICWVQEADEPAALSAAGDDVVIEQVLVR